MIAELCELQEDELNEWEARFLDNVAKIVAEGGSLTKPQEHMVKTLYKREIERDGTED